MFVETGNSINFAGMFSPVADADIESQDMNI